MPPGPPSAYLYSSSFFSRPFSPSPLLPITIHTHSLCWSRHVSAPPLRPQGLSQSPNRQHRELAGLQLHLCLVGLVLEPDPQDASQLAPAGSLAQVCFFCPDHQHQHQQQQRLWPECLLVLRLSVLAQPALSREHRFILQHGHLDVYLLDRHQQQRLHFRRRTPGHDSADLTCYRGRPGSLCRSRC